VRIRENHTESTGVPQFSDQHLSILNELADGVNLLIFEWKYLEANLHPSNSFQLEYTLYRFLREESTKIEDATRTNMEEVTMQELIWMSYR